MLIVVAGTVFHGMPEPPEKRNQPKQKTESTTTKWQKN